MILLIDMQAGLRPLDVVGNHVHSCPSCYEHVPCEMRCSVEPDLTLDDGTLRGAFLDCEACASEKRSTDGR